ncbi:MAG: shikimate kinase [Flavobacteriaceae bacterium]|nr:shikimate kinase [Flavobacteriaceae bacterium]
MKIVLVGYMGSGKSTIGKEISKIVGIPFYDLDVIIEKREQTSIKNIFETKGEIYFRKIEHEILNDFLEDNDDFILALGGGTPCYANNHVFLQNKDISSFYLKMSVEALVSRLKNEKEKRPIIANLSNEDLDEFVRKHLFDRNYYYLQSKHIISTENKSIKEISDKIIATYSK